MAAKLPARPEFRVIATQLVRSATGIGANYRAACRSRSKREFIARLGVVEEEADESAYWLELLSELNVPQPVEVGRLLDEANQIVAIFVTARRTAKANG